MGQQEDGDLQDDRLSTVGETSSKQNRDSTMIRHRDRQAGEGYNCRLEGKVKMIMLAESH